MNQLMKVLKAVAIVLATVLVTLVIGIVVIYVLAFIEKKGHWEQFATPPGNVVRLVAGDIDHVVVKTDRGATYEVQCRTNEEYPCLEEVDSPEDFYQSTCDREDFPEPKGNVRDRLLACEGYEYIIRAQYVLRDDGTLWRWKIEIFPYGQLARVFQIMALSLIVGLVAGVVIANNWRR
jgi:membrane-associated protease RseP (regulator of RpoE activity)